MICTVSRPGRSSAAVAASMLKFRCRASGKWPHGAATNRPGAMREHASSTTRRTYLTPATSRRFQNRTGFLVAHRIYALSDAWVARKPTNFLASPIVQEHLARWAFACTRLPEQRLRIGAEPQFQALGWVNSHEFVV